jgi:hypothetical protein
MGERSAVRHLEQVADHLDWNPRPEFADQVRLALLRHAGEQLIHEPHDIGFHPRDRALVQRAQDQPPHPRVQRRSLNTRLVVWCS